MQIYSVDMNLKCEISSNSSYFHIKNPDGYITSARNTHNFKLNPEGGSIWIIFFNYFVMHY